MRASRQKMLCSTCEARIPLVAFCPQCGYPTQYASQEERTRWDLERWTSSRNGSKNGQRDEVIDLAALEREAQPEAVHAREKPARRAERWPDKPAERVRDFTAAPGRARRSRRLPGEERWRRLLPTLEGETVHLVSQGRCGPDRVTLVVTRYRVAVVGSTRVSWIPIESVSTITLVDDKRLVVSGSIERLSFRHPDPAAIDSIYRLLDAEVLMGRMPGGLRHHPDVMQAWAERVTDVWQSNFRSVKLWVHRHPAAAALLR